MRVFQRSLVALGIAAVLPTVIFAGVAAFYVLDDERRQVEAETLARARTVMTLVDARLRGDIAALEILSTSSHFAQRDWAEFYPRVQRTLRANPDWASVVLHDVRSGEEIFDLRQPFAAPRKIPLAGGGDLVALERSGRPLVGDIDTSSDPVAFVYLPVLEQQQVHYVLAAAIRPHVFQDILVGQTTRDATAAVVDRNGLFVARNLHFAQRVGTPATAYLRATLGKESGFYRGVTYEGLENYTAFHTSHWSGWATHIAVPSALIDTPRTWSFAVAALAGLGTVLLGGSLVVLVLRDMAERRRSEETLRQSQKMEAIGQLTGGIAHDFNNLLTAVIGNLDLIRTRSAPNERLQNLADNALEAARRGAKLASQLLAFSRTQRMTIAPVDLERLLGNVSGLLTQSVGPAIALRVDIDPTARVVMSDPNQLELALLNVAVNARDAMPAGGQIVISSRRAAQSDVADLPKREYVALSIEDQGQGMSEDVRARAVEPFFTTKPVGQGTGLGLSQVYGVVRESGGALHIDSTPGNGTTIRLLLPMARADAITAALAKPAALATAAPQAQQHAILVVDDDKLVRGFMTESLQGLGYRVLSATDGEQALELLQDRSVDLLLVDFAMPGMNGAELIRTVRRQHPALRALLVSGYADSFVIEAAAGSVPLLRKPFNLAELSAAVAEALRK